MRLGSFEVIEPLPDLKSPHAFAILRPWIDAGNVGTMVLNRLEGLFDAKEIGRLVRPGNFFDFTRYRPTMYYKEGVRQLVLPNSIISCARRESRNDFVFLHLLEPHMFGERYTSSVLLILEKLGVQRYCLLGSMYDMVPHTRPLLVSGGAVGAHAIAELDRAGVGRSNYQGPTTICHLISQQATMLGIETMSLITHLPQYTELDEDYTGQVRLLEVFQSLYGIPVNKIDIQKAQQQIKDIEIAVNNNRKVKEVVAQLEAMYDARIAAGKKEEMPRLSPEIENFLKEMEKRFRQT